MEPSQKRLPTIYNIFCANLSICTTNDIYFTQLTGQVLFYATQCLR